MPPRRRWPFKSRIRRARAELRGSLEVLKGVAMPKVFKFRKYAITQDDYVTSSRMATRKRIKQLGGEIIPDTEAKIDDAFLKDGWTEKNFDLKQT